MMARITNLEWNGQPVYRSWLTPKKCELAFDSREIKMLPSGGWKFVRWVRLFTLKVDRRHSIKRIMEQARQAELNLVKLPGIKVVR